VSSVARESAGGQAGRGCGGGWLARKAVNGGSQSSAAHNRKGKKRKNAGTEPTKRWVREPMVRRITPAALDRVRMDRQKKGIRGPVYQKKESTIYLCWQKGAEEGGTRKRNRKGARRCQILALMGRGGGTKERETTTDTICSRRTPAFVPCFDKCPDFVGCRWGIIVGRENTHKKESGIPPKNKQGYRRTKRWRGFRVGRSKILMAFRHALVLHRRKKRWEAVSIFTLLNQEKRVLTRSITWNSGVCAKLRSTEGVVKIM